MNSTVVLDWNILDRMERAVAKVRDRLLRATTALNQANIPYAVVGGNAVASWVATVDEGAVRNTRDIDVLIRRDDLPAVTRALEQAGFVRADVLDLVVFLDGPNAKPSEAIHLLFAGERTRPDHALAAPEIATAADPAGFRVLTLESLVLEPVMDFFAGRPEFFSVPIPENGDFDARASEKARKSRGKVNNRL